MKYAVIEASGSQHIVEEGKPIELMAVPQEKGKPIEFTSLLLLVDGAAVTIGTPHIAGGRVIGEVQNVYKGKKIRVAHFRAKSRYRKIQGFRPQLTEVMIKKIEVQKKGK